MDHPAAFQLSGCLSNLPVIVYAPGWRDAQHQRKVFCPRTQHKHVLARAQMALISRVTQWTAHLPHTQFLPGSGRATC